MPLDTYAAERMPVAERLLQTTDRGFAFVVSDHWFSRMLRTRVLALIPALAMRFDAARTLAFRAISQTGIAYPDSALSQTEPGLPVESPRAGDRFPWMKLIFTSGAPAEDLFTRLDDTRFNLILVGQAEGFAAVHASVVVHEIPDLASNVAVLKRAGIRRPSYFLLRPDGHIGLAGGRLMDGAVQRYFAERIAG